MLALLSEKFLHGNFTNPKIVLNIILFYSFIKVFSSSSPGKTIPPGMPRAPAQVAFCNSVLGIVFCFFVRIMND
jgi:hypothetical protein